MANASTVEQMAERLLTEPEVAKVLGVSQRTVFSLRISGKLGCAKIGRAVRYRLAELERFIRESEGCIQEGAR